MPGSPSTSPPIDTVSGVPQIAKAHEQVAEYYRQRIRSGRMKPGSEFPTVRALAADWNTSVSTVQQAVALLREGGWVDVSQGRRAVVRGIPDSQK